MSDALAQTKRRLGRTATWALVFVSLLAVLILAPVALVRCCGAPPSPKELCVGTVCVVLCVAAFLVCPKRYLIAKLFTFLFLWPSIYLGMEMVSYHLFTTDVLRFFHRWNL